MKYTKELHDNFRSSIDSNNIADNPFWAKVTALLDEIDRQAAEIAELKAGHQWIPVSERLPEVPEGYYVDIIAINTNNKKPNPFATSYDGTCGFESVIVTHWLDLNKLMDSLPLPEAK